MKNVKFCALIIFMVMATSLFLTSCNDTDDSGKPSRIIVRMVDAPGDYEEVNIEVLDVLIKNNSDTNDQGWVSIGNITPGIYNLLSLTGGVNVLLADNMIPSGHLGQIRLLLGNDNTIVKNGVMYPLKTPSAQQSGLKLKINQTLLAGVTYDFLLDFDVEHSVVVEAGGSGNFNLHPVIRVSTSANAGVVKGAVSPIGVQVLVSAQVNDVVVSAFTNESGLFQLNGIPAGTYSVTFTPDSDSGLLPLVVENVVVVNGEATNMGELFLE